MKTAFFKPISSKIHLKSIISLSLILTFLNMTGCALSRQFIRTNTGHAYGTGITTTTLSDETVIFGHNNSENDLIVNGIDNFYQEKESLVDIASSSAIKTQQDISDYEVKVYPAHIWARGIFSTGTSIIIVVDLYE